MVTENVPAGDGHIRCDPLAAGINAQTRDGPMEGNGVHIPFDYVYRRTSRFLIKYLNILRSHQYNYLAANRGIVQT